jgi:filamentous hemagglutinin
MKTKHYRLGKGGRHRVSRTSGNTQNSKSTLSPRAELATDIWDRQKIYQEDGLYDSTIRESLQDVIEQNKETFPDMFEEGKK